METQKQSEEEFARGIINITKWNHRGRGQRINNQIQQVQRVIPEASRHLNTISNKKAWNVRKNRDSQDFTTNDCSWTAWICLESSSLQRHIGFVSCHYSLGNPDVMFLSYVRQSTLRRKRDKKSSMTSNNSFIWVLQTEQTTLGASFAGQSSSRWTAKWNDLRLWCTVTFLKRSIFFFHTENCIHVQFYCWSKLISGSE